jgi:hypothetical protein
MPTRWEPIEGIAGLARPARPPPEGSRSFDVLRPRPCSLILRPRYELGSRMVATFIVNVLVTIALLDEAMA